MRFQPTSESESLASEHSFIIFKSFFPASCLGPGRNFEHPLNTWESSVQYSVPLLSWGTFRCPPRAPAPWGEGRSQQSGSLLLNENQLLLFAGVCIANGLCKTPRGWVGLHCTGSTCLGADAGRVSTAAFSLRSPKLSSQQPPGVFHQILKVTTKFFQVKRILFSPLPSTPFSVIFILL